MDTAARDSGDPVSESFPIVGGLEEWGFPLVGMMAADNGGSYSAFCTATPVTPTVIITAAHCLDAIYDYGSTPIAFGMISPDGTGSYKAVDKSTRRVHPQWNYDYYNYVHDVALIKLSDPIDADMFPLLRRSSVGSGDIGTTLTVVGYGMTNPSGGGTGVKRSIFMNIVETHGQYFVLHTSPYRNGICYGDSGGPSFVPGELRDIQYGIHARTQVETCGPGEDTDVGYYYESFIKPTVLSLDPGAGTCGDGVCTGIEEEPTCPSDCGTYQCGDGMVEDPEVCDDGNTVGGDGCSADCLSDETCGNGVADAAAGEICDDGNAAGGDGCSADCLSDETCGNGIVDAAAGEICDDGNAAGGDGCSADCLSDETCGNGIVDAAAGEMCDDGNTVGRDGCSADCGSDEACGNNIIDEEMGEMCDDGNRIAGDGCSAGCGSDETCGNGVLDIQMGETCDDGNREDGDGCPGDCGKPSPTMTGGCGCRTAGSSGAGSSAPALVILAALMLIAVRFRLRFPIPVFFSRKKNPDKV